MKRAAFGVVAILLSMVVFLIWAALQFHRQQLNSLAGLCALLAVLAAVFIPANARVAWRSVRGGGTDFIRVKGGK